MRRKYRQISFGLTKALSGLLIKFMFHFSAYRAIPTALKIAVFSFISPKITQNEVRVKSNLTTIHHSYTSLPALFCE